jgi:hypothetical protein
MLEVSRVAPRSAAIAPNIAGKLISHILACHNAVIFLHALRIGEEGKG